MLPYNKLDPIPPSECYVDAGSAGAHGSCGEWDMVIVNCAGREEELIPVDDLPFDYLDAEGEVMTVFVSEILNIRIDYVGLGRIFYLVNHTSGWQAVVYPEDYRELMIQIHKVLRLWNYLFTDQTIRIEFTTTDQWGTVTEVWEAGNNLLRKDGEIQLTIQLSNIIRRYLWV
jgi:hypothetical protein